MTTPTLILAALLVATAGCMARQATVEHWAADGSYTRIVAQPIGKGRAGACIYDYSGVKPAKDGSIRPRKSCAEIAGAYGSPGLYEFFAGLVSGVAVYATGS